MYNFKKNEKITGFKTCPYFVKILNKLKPVASENIHLDPEREYIGKTIDDKKLVSPCLLKFGSTVKVIANGTDEILAHCAKKSSFGRRLEFAPQPGWGKFSASPGFNRAGNALPDNQDLYSSKKSEFPKTRNILTSEQNKEIKKMISSFGKINRALAKVNKTKSKVSAKKIKARNSLKKSKYGKEVELMPSGSMKYLTSRGNDGFDKVPNSIYSNDGTQVFTKNFSPYAGAPTSGILPRPYGPRDMAVLKGLPYAVKDSTEMNAFGRHSFGPFINQAYNARNQENFGPFINQAYNARSSFGNNQLANEIGFVNESRNQFRPSQIMTRKGVNTNIPTSGLYMPGYSPFNVVSNNFGLNPTLYQSMGPNTENTNGKQSMLLYPGAGANTINYFTNKDYYPDNNNGLRVQKHNNPTGFLSNKEVKSVSGLKSSKFGKDKPWVMDKLQEKRPMTTNLFQNGESSSAGFQRIAQPLELYSYQNNKSLGYEYPNFLGSRMWTGGFGNNKPTKKSVSSKKKSIKKSKSLNIGSTKIPKVTTGDTLKIKNGKIEVIKAKAKPNKN
jgi:hypothetical protein